MPNLARSPALTKPRGAAPRHISASAPWPLLGMLPAPLAQLPNEMRAILGHALDQGFVRYALDEVTGAAFVVRSIRR